MAQYNMLKGKGKLNDRPPVYNEQVEWYRFDCKLYRSNNDSI